MTYELIDRVVEDSFDCRLEHVKHGNCRYYQVLVISSDGLIVYHSTTKDIDRAKRIFESYKMKIL